MECVGMVLHPCAGDLAFVRKLVQACSGMKISFGMLHNELQKCECIAFHESWNPSGCPV